MHCGRDETTWTEGRNHDNGKRTDRVAETENGRDVVRHQAAFSVHQRAGNYGIRHSRGSAGGHRHCCHHAFPSENTGIVGCHSRRHQRSVRSPFEWPLDQRILCARSSARRLLEGCCGQGTLEYALVMAGFLSVIVALASLWRVLDGGVFVEHALMSASHHVQAVAPGVATDVFLF